MMFERSIRSVRPVPSRRKLAILLALAGSPAVLGCTDPADAEVEEETEEEQLVIPDAVDPVLAEQSLRSLELELGGLLGDGRSYWDLTVEERARFDSLARAREYRLGTHASDHAVPREYELSAGGASSAAPTWPGGPSGPAGPILPPILPGDPPDPDPEVVQYFHKDVVARPIFRASYVLPASSKPRTFSTSDLKRTLGAKKGAVGSFGPELVTGDTMLVVERGGQTWFNDDCKPGAKESCVETSRYGGTFTVTVFAKTPGDWGYMDLVTGSSTLASDALFGGTLLDVAVPSDGPYGFETIHVPGGATDTQLFLFDDAWEVQGRDENSGIGSAARILYNLQTGGHKLLVGSFAASTMGATRLTSVVMNPCPTETHKCQAIWPADSHRGDRDGDGLANALEEEIGTDPDNADMDGDGLFDYMEVIGHREGDGEQALGLYGASPFRKDIFVEIDRQQGTAAIPYGQMLDASLIFNDMPSVTNPDGSAGISIHIDTGAPCPAPMLCGDWGGSDELVVGDVAGYHSSAENILPNFAPVRRRLFFYAFEQMLYSGNLGPGLRIDDEAPGEVLVHELGHKYGLHHGAVAAGRNSTAAYPSLMNYAYSYSLPGVSTARGRFSEGLLDQIDHRWLNEANYSPGAPKTHLGSDPFGWTVVGDTVDFNGDGRISDSPVLFDDGPIERARTGGLSGPNPGAWPETVGIRNVGDTLATGGPGIAVKENDAEGFGATTWLFIPYAHADGVYPDASELTDTVGSGDPFPEPSGGVPLPGGGLPDGEATAQSFTIDGEDGVIVLFPNAEGVLYYNWYLRGTGFSQWNEVPGFPSETAARSATLSVVDEELVALYRDVTAEEDEPNTWLTRLSSGGSWGDWETLSVPSWTTPGLAEATDGQEYLAYVGSGPSHSVRFARREAGSLADWEGLSFPVLIDSKFVDAPPEARTRVSLLFRRYQYAFGTPFEDDSGYLNLFWGGGDPAERGTWRLYRAYSEGYISPSGNNILSKPMRWRAQEHSARPWPLHSPSVAPRHWDVQASFSREDWAAGEQNVPVFIPYASGMGPENPTPQLDRNDNLVIAKAMCETLQGLAGDPCVCIEGPNSGCEE